MEMVRAKSDYLGPHTFTIGLKWTQISIFQTDPKFPKHVFHTTISYKMTKCGGLGVKWSISG